MGSHHTGAWPTSYTALARRRHPRFCYCVLYIYVLPSSLWETKLKGQKLLNFSFPRPYSPPPTTTATTTTKKQQPQLILAMPLNCIAPKPENQGNIPMEGLSRTSESDNSAVLTYPMQTNSQSILQHTLYSINLKVCLLFILGPVPYIIFTHYNMVNL